MLVLSRKELESIMIGDDVRVTLVEIRGDKVRIGIEAPTEVPVHREEIYAKIKAGVIRDPRVSPPAEGGRTHEGREL